MRKCLGGLTAFINKLLNTHKYYFLFRPRRFGKFLLLGTLDYLYKGGKDLFKGLYIKDKWDFEVYPVIKISFSRFPCENNNLENLIRNELFDIANSYKIELNEDRPLQPLNNWNETQIIKKAVILNYHGEDTEKKSTKKSKNFRRV